MPTLAHLHDLRGVPRLDERRGRLRYSFGEPDPPEPTDFAINRAVAAEAIGCPRGVGSGFWWVGGASPSSSRG